MQQDELAMLFAQQMSFAPAQALQPTPPPEPQPQPQPGQQVPVLPQSPQQTQRASSEPITYISTHYTHSSHVRPSHISPPSSNPPSSPPSNPQLSRPELEMILQRNSVNPALLFPSQLSLFQSATNDQRTRLLELWRICPPTVEDHERCWESGMWPDSTSVQNEEDMARTRWEERERWDGLHLKELDLQQRNTHRQREEWRNQDPHFDVAFSSGLVNDATAAAQLQPVSPIMTHRQAEPYMLSGYEQLARREYEDQARLDAQRDVMAMDGVAAPLQESTRYNQATDPVYHRVSHSKGHQDMENQYGRAMGFVPPSPGDDEMVM